MRNTVNGTLRTVNGIHRMEVKYYDENGIRKTKSRTTNLPKIGNEKRARKMLAEFEKEILKEISKTQEQKCLLFVDFLGMWLEYIKSDVKVSTFAGYRNCIKIIKQYFDPMNVLLSELQPLDIHKFYQAQLSLGKSPNTIHHYHANIHKALKYAVKLGIIASNPADKVDKPKNKKYDAVFYSEREMIELFKLFRGDRIELCIHIAAQYGLRRSEIIGLKWNAIDFDKNTISINHKVTEALDENGNYKLVKDNSLKTDSSKRSFPLSPRMKEILMEEKDRQCRYKEMCRDSYNYEYDEYVCKHPTGELITPSFLSDHFRYMIKKHNLRKIRLHDLRHTCASLMLKNGVSMKEIQDWLGHSSYNTTSNIYCHLDSSAKIRSASIIENTMNNIIEASL